MTDMLERAVTAALVALAEHGTTTDVQELLVRGGAGFGPPRAIYAMIRAAAAALMEPDIQTRDAGTHALYPYDQSYGWAPKAALEVWQAMLRTVLEGK